MKKVGEKRMRQEDGENEFDQGGQRVELGQEIKADQMIPMAWM
jgi:hypothetical protein